MVRRKLPRSRPRPTSTTRLHEEAETFRLAIDAAKLPAGVSPHPDQFRLERRSKLSFISPSLRIASRSGGRAAQRGPVNSPAAQKWMSLELQNGACSYRVRSSRKAPRPSPLGSRRPMVSTCSSAAGSRMPKPVEPLRLGRPAAGGRTWPWARVRTRKLYDRLARDPVDDERGRVRVFVDFRNHSPSTREVGAGAGVGAGSMCRISAATWVLLVNATSDCISGRTRFRAMFQR